MTWINIPEDWKGNQALAIVEFLDEISAAIWSTHELKMLDAWKNRESKEIRTTKQVTKTHTNTDDFPF